MLVCVVLFRVAAAAQELEPSPEAVPTAAAAQTTAPDEGNAAENLAVPSWAQSIVDSFSKPLHPVIGGVASGGGLGFGLGYDSPDTQRWYRDAEAMLTVRRYWSFEGEVGRRSLSTRSQIGAFGAVRHMSRLDYFGLGPDSSLDDRSAFTLRETAFGTRGWFHATPAIRVGGSVAAYMPNLERGASPSVRSVEQVFASASATGFDAEPMFGRYRGFIELLYPALDASDESVGYGAAYQLAFEAVRDLDSGQHNFRRWEAEVKQRVPGLRAGQRLTLHGLLATTNSGADVPFYLLYTLGGSGGLKSFRPDMLGTDGTRATLRGFRSYRFRDRNLVLMQAEYRIPLHKYVHTTVFVDAGQVAPSASQLFSRVRTNTGFSIGYVRKGRTIGRLDLGFAGGEGAHISWTFGLLD
jgi:hypothetical protein